MTVVVTAAAVSVVTRRDGELSERGNSDRRPQGERRNFRREDGNSAPRRRTNNDA